MMMWSKMHGKELTPKVGGVSVSELVHCGLFRVVDHDFVVDNSSLR
jgi:hypothetical protein